MTIQHLSQNPVEVVALPTRVSMVEAGDIRSSNHQLSGDCCD